MVSKSYKCSRCLRRASVIGKPSDASPLTILIDEDPAADFLVNVSSIPLETAVNNDVYVSNKNGIQSAGCSLSSIPLCIDNAVESTVNNNNNNWNNVAHTADLVNNISSVKVSESPVTIEMLYNEIIASKNSNIELVKNMQALNVKNDQLQLQIEQLQQNCLCASGRHKTSNKYEVSPKIKKLNVVEKVVNNENRNKISNRGLSYAVVASTANTLLLNDVTSAAPSVNNNIESTATEKLTTYGNSRPVGDWVMVNTNNNKNKNHKKVVNGSNASNELEVFAKYKWVHLSSFKNNVTTENIINYISKEYPKAFSSLRFIKRHGSYFKDPYTLKVLYTAFVRSKLEYASFIWNPSASVHMNRLEKVQRVFIKIALGSIFKTDPLPNYNSRNLLLGLKSLAFRRICLLIYFFLM